MIDSIEEREKRAWQVANVVTHIAPALWSQVSEKTKVVFTQKNEVVFPVGMGTLTIELLPIRDDVWAGYSPQIDRLAVRVLPR